jgi:ABC-type iron transport system FetAB permease component
MNWWMLPVMIIFIIITLTISQKAKLYIIKKIVITQILKQVGISEDWVIQGYNLFYAFVLVPIFLMAFALFTNQPLEYSLIYSIVVYGSSFLML